MVDLSVYANLKICVAVSGGKDSMALLHLLHTRGRQFGITLSALNCDHKIRGEASARDSAFVREWCEKLGVPLVCFEEDIISVAKKSAVSVETAARIWRRKCYKLAAEKLGADAVATAHHLNDNAETVLFNLARGSALSGLIGITDRSVDGLKLIRPLKECSRKEIDDYVSENGVPYVEDESNFTDDYTRNYIRHNVLPRLEEAVPNAAKAIYRFSFLAAEDEDYFEGIIKERGIITETSAGSGAEITFCAEKPVFKRAAVKVVKGTFGRKDYTSEHAERLYKLQFAENGKKFEFLGLTAFKEEGKIAICEEAALQNYEAVPFIDYLNGKTDLGGQMCLVVEESGLQEKLNSLGNAVEFKVLKFDLDSVPSGAEMRTVKVGDKFTKFGGGTKSLGDYFTDKKIPVRLRKQIPLVVCGGEVFAVCGVEISEKIKITARTKRIGCLICADYAHF